MKPTRRFWSYLAQLALETELFQTKVLVKIKAHFKSNNVFFKENLAVYELTWKNNVEPYRPQMTIWYMHIAWWIPKATNTNSECAILVAFLRQQ